MRRVAALLALAAAAAAAAPAQAAPRFEPLDGTYDLPIYVTAPPRDTTRVFVVEQEGLVKVVVNGVLQPEPFADVIDAVELDGERGLLSMAFPPDYETSGLAYLYLTARDTGELQVLEIHRSAADPNRTDATRRVVWRHAHPAGNHNGGQIHFGPDGMLWLAPGDGGGGNDVPNNAQRLDTELGKVLRIDPRPGPSAGFTVPADNPFASASDGAVDTIWASGLRNPYRFSFDRVTGDLSIGDVGQGNREEIDHVRFADGLGVRGDFGWRCYEGSIRTPGVAQCEPRGPYIRPVFDYARDEGRTVTGGVVVRDPGLPTLVGRYIYADFFRAEIRSLALDAPGADPQDAGLEGADATSVAAFGEDACGNVYVVSLDGPVNRLADTDEPGCVLKPEPKPLPPAPPPHPPPPPPAQPSGPPTASPDARRPTLRVRVTGRRSLVARRRLRISLRSDEAATVTVTGRLRGVARFRTARLRLAAGRTRVVSLRISRRSARKLRRTLRRKRVVTRLSIRARDAAGNQRLAGRRVVIRRR